MAESKPGYMKKTDPDTASEPAKEGANVADEKKSEQSDAVKQAHKQALSPDQKHQAYLDDLERLHRESEVDQATGKTAYVG